MLIGGDGKLYVGVSERTTDATRMLAQSPASPLGKVLRINLDGSVPEDNPYALVKAAEPRIWSIGHRDVEGLALDSTGRLWISDHGPQGGDEIDIVRPGHNYGWPLVAYGEEYTGAPINGGRTQWPGTDQPEYYWDPAIAPSGIAFYSGTLIPEWRGNLFVSALAGRRLIRLVLRGIRVGRGALA
jgi:glucose/arabinose dehydrogenase